MRMVIPQKEESRQADGRMVLPDICVCCGEPAPEGRQICWKCEHFDDDDIEVKNGLL